MYLSFFLVIIVVVVVFVELVVFAVYCSCRGKSIICRDFLVVFVLSVRDMKILILFI